MTEIDNIASTSLATYVNSATLIEMAQTNNMMAVGSRLSNFASELKNLLIDGIDYGYIPKVDKPCLFKSGGEKIMLVLGLTPQFTMTEKQSVPTVLSNEYDDRGNEKLVSNGYYMYEFKCDLYYGDRKVSEGVGTANTRERKFRNQSKKGIYAEDLSNTVLKIAKKRAFMDAILAVSCVSDMFTQDLEDNEAINEAKVDKSAKTGRISVAEARILGTEAWARGISMAETVAIYKEVDPNCEKSTDIKKTDFPTILDKIRNYKKENKEQ